MRKSFKIVVGILMLSKIAIAQSVLDETIVTASKFPEKQSQTGKVINVISDSVLRANSSLSVGQLLNQQVGVYALGSGQTLGSTQNVSVRGAGFGLTLILIDGKPVNDPSVIGSTFDINLLNTNQIERIEILKGGQSTIYGSDAVAGVINIITKKGTKEKISGSVNASLGSFNTSILNLNLLGTLNKTSYQFGIGNTNSKGYSSATEPLNFVGKFGPNGYNNLNYSGRIDQQISNSFSANVNFRNTDYTSKLDNMAFDDEKDFSAKNHNLQIGAGFEYAFKNNKMVFNYLKNSTERSYLNDSTFISKNAYSNYSSQKYKSQGDYLELYTNIKINDKNQLLLGADYRNQSMHYEGFDISSYGKYVYAPLKNAKIQNSSAYFSISSKFSSKLGLEYGARLNHHSTYDFNYTYSLSPYFLIASNFKLFGSINSSYRNPALYNLYSEYGNLDLKPETSKNAEIGIQYIVKNANFRFVGFNRNLKNVIFFQSTSKPPYGKYINQNSQNDNGLEAEASINLGKLGLNANYTLINSKMTVLNNGNDSTYSNTLRKPKNVFNASLNYNFSKKLNAGVSLQYVSNRIDKYYNASTYKVEVVDLEAYTLCNFNLNYKILEKMSVSFAAQNIFNKNYTEIYGYKSRPRSLQIGINYNF